VDHRLDDAKEVPPPGLPRDYVDYVREFLRFVGPQAHSISVCQPTVPVLAAVSLMAAAGEKLPRSLTMMGGPLDTRASPTAVNDFAQFRPMSWFESKVVQRVPMRYPGFMRRVYPGFLQFAGFVAMNRPVLRSARAVLPPPHRATAAARSRTAASTTSTTR
jgi:poly(3-hydroxybutyrate) depolymerase